MRSIKELLQILLSNQQYFSLGLCHWTHKLYNNGLISDDEDNLLYAYIRKNRPSMYSSIGAWRQRNSDWFWKQGNIEPRIKWINKHILKQH